MTATPIDLSRYEGRTPGEWVAQEPKETYSIGGHLHTIFQVTGLYSGDEGYDDLGVAVCIIPHEDLNPATLAMVKANATFIADAPLLVAEVERLRGEVARLTPDAENYRDLLEMYHLQRTQVWKHIDFLTDEATLATEQRSTALSQRDKLAGALQYLLDAVQLAPKGWIKDSRQRARAALAKVRQGTGGGDDGR